MNSSRLKHHTSINSRFIIEAYLTHRTSCIQRPTQRFLHGSQLQVQARKQRRLPASYYRGGTSRAVLFNGKDLPSNRYEWSNIFRGVIGSPDVKYGRQLDGMGGGLSSLSKVCVVETCPDDDPDGADVDYTFAAIGVRDDEVDFSSNCGNMTSAIGPFALDAGLIKHGRRPDEKVDPGYITVRIRNTNTSKIIDATFPIDDDGSPQMYGDFAIDGVVGTASKIRLAFLNPAGSKTGSLLPTSSIIDTIHSITVTCIDVGNPCVFVPASAVSVPGEILPDAIESHPTLLHRLDEIRKEAAVRMGISETIDRVPGSIPKIAIVSQGKNGKSDITVRAISVGQPHRAVPITVAMALASATEIKGSIPYELCHLSRSGAHGPVDADGVTIGHPTGTILVTSTFGEEKASNGEPIVTDATVFRTARLLMKGEVYWRQ